MPPVSDRLGQSRGRVPCAFAGRLGRVGESRARHQQRAHICSGRGIRTPSSSSEAPAYSERSSISFSVAGQKETPESRARRCSEPEPADSLRDKFNLSGGWLPSLTFASVNQMRMPLTQGRNPSGSDTQPPLAHSNWDAAQVGIYLGAGAVILSCFLGPAAVVLGFFLEFILPIPVCLRARSKVSLLSMIPNAVLNSWFVFVQAPKSSYWAGWRNEWAGSLGVLAFGAAASLIVAGLILWRRKTTQLT
jgi:hypothetical protein